MAIDKVISGDTRNDFGNKYNNTVDEIPVSGVQSSNGVITFTKQGGGTFNVQTSKTPNSLIDGLSVVINEVLSQA